VHSPQKIASDDVALPSLSHTKRNNLGIVLLRRIASRIVPANQSLYKLEKQSGYESFRPTNEQSLRKVGLW
jgi:hypothetical protein